MNSTEHQVTKRPYKRNLFLGCLIGVLVLLACFLVPCLNTNNLCGRWFVWREPTIESYVNYPQLILQNDPANISELPKVEIDQVINDYTYKNHSIDSFLQANETAAFIVLHKDSIVYESYYNGAARDSRNTAFSITKSFVSALLGIAIDLGHVSSVNDSVTKYIPELGKEYDEITLEHLLTMSSGVQYKETELFGSVPAWWSDDYKASFSPDMRSTLLNLNIEKPPLTEFLYNSYNSGFIGLVVERATNQPLADFAQNNLWQPMGTEFTASWSADSDEFQFPQTDGGLNVSAIDLVRFGKLFLNSGYWNGQQIISSDWVNKSTTQGNNLLEVRNRQYIESPDISKEIKEVIASWRYYYHWWGVEREDHSAIFANGNLGQFIYILPEQDLVVVRTGYSWGEDMNDDLWLAFFHDFTDNFTSTPH